MAANTDSDPPTAADSDHAFLERFRTGWEAIASTAGATPPDPFEALRARESQARVCRSQVVVDLLLVDQMYRWRGESPWRVEDYLARRPSLAGDREAMLDLLFGEWCCAKNAGKPIAWSDLQQRFPDYSDDLRRDAAFASWVADPGGLSAAGTLRDASATGAPATDQEPRPPRDPRADFDRGARDLPLVHLEDFEVEAEVARGGMSIVKRARNKSTGERVALKFLQSECWGRPRLAQRFAREARVVARLNHPRIVVLRGVGRSAEGERFLVLDWHEGPHLPRPEACDWPPRRVLEMGAALADALAHAHEAGVVHRDIKPGNILLDAAGQPLLTDFGLALDQIGDYSWRTAAGELLGTPAYMAPEQVSDLFGEVGPPTDVYGLGAVLYSCLARRPPYKGTEAESIWKKITGPEPPPALGAAGAGLPPDAVELIQRCLEKQPNQRPTARELADTLRRLLDDWKDAPTADEETRVIPSRPRDAASATRRGATSLAWSAAWGFVAALALAVAALALWMVTR